MASTVSKSKARLLRRLSVMGRKMLRAKTRVLKSVWTPAQEREAQRQVREIEKGFAALEKQWDHPQKVEEKK